VRLHLGLVVAYVEVLAILRLQLIDGLLVGGVISALEWVLRRDGVSLLLLIPLGVDVGDRLVGFRRDLLASEVVFVGELLRIERRGGCRCRPHFACDTGDAGGNGKGPPLGLLEPADSLGLASSVGGSFSFQLSSKSSADTSRNSRACR
jgi:hypothetical protein